MDARQKSLIEYFKEQEEGIKKLRSEIKEKGVIIKLSNEDAHKTINSMFCSLKQFNYQEVLNNEHNNPKDQLNHRQL